jgi:acyl dehydratase
MTGHYLEDVEVGHRFGGAARIRVEKDRIMAFAAEFDPQPFHLDEAAAGSTMFRGLAASGWHTAAVTMRLLVESDFKLAGGIVGAGFDELRWPCPVRPGDELCVDGEVPEVRPSKSRPDQGLIKVRATTLNQRAVFVATQAAVKHMKAGGRIINIGSCNAERMPFAGGAVYAMSKAALLGLVKGLARDLGPRGITINNVQPGPVDTEMNPANSDFAEMLRNQMALPRYSTADEIAAMVAYLAGPEAGFVTGASLMIDGGFTA